MSAVNKLSSTYLLFLLCSLTTSPLCAQQLVPRLVRQFSAIPGVNLKASAIREDVRGRLWIASDDGAVRFDGKQFRVFHDPLIRKGDYYYQVIPAPDGRVWLKMGLGHSISYVNPRQDSLIRLPDTTRLVRDYLARYGSHCLYADAGGVLWIGLKKKGLLTFDPRTGAVRHVVDRPLDVRSITQDRRGLVYFTTSKQGLFTYAPKTGQLSEYHHDEQDTTSLSNDATFSVLARPDGTILVGVPNEVDQLDPATGKFRHLRLNQLPSADSAQAPHVVYFHQDSQENSWFTTGVATYRYTKAGVLQWVVLPFHSGTIDEILVGSADKLWVCALGTLYEYDLTRLQTGSNLIIQRVVVSGSVLNLNTPVQSLLYDSTGNPTLTIPEYAPFRVDFALSATKRPHFIRWRLNGNDHEWRIGEGYNGLVNYQLPAGTYTLLVNRGRAAGGWESVVSTMKIVVVPPFWKTTPVVLTALLLLGGLGYYLIRAYTRRQQLRRQLSLEQHEAANLRHLDELKTRFFGNVTHEFRTPLTLILHATEQLISRPTTDWERERLNTVNRNADQLARLITQMLDIAKMDAQKLTVQLKLGDPVLFVRQCADEFTDLASQLRIELTVNELVFDDVVSANGRTTGDPAERMYHFDDDKLGKIIYNLLSNALKFTPEAGSIRVSSGCNADGQLHIRVQDTGIGIAPDQLGRIFDRFYQADASTTRRYEGTGIGLAYVRELTELLGGRVLVESTPGAGSTFTVTLPMLAGAAGVALIDPASKPVLPANSRPLSQSAGTNEFMSTIATDKLLVLLVEDNQELRAYMAGQLRLNYQVLEAANGRSGIDQALVAIPDLIVSDVMMPDVDGYTLLETLKQDERTSHIPILMLTAKSAFDSRMQGLYAGADDYLSKPFSFAELHTRIHNMLLTRRHWQEHLIAGQLPALLHPPSVSPIEHSIPDREKQFLERLRQAILTNLTNEEVGVDWLREQARMSRTQLHRKLTALTNLSTTGFIHSVRLGKAQELLTTDNEMLSIAEVAYQVGYSSPAYFSKVFTDRFGYPPIRMKVDHA